MAWIYFIFVLLICRRSTLAQQGYDYSKPAKPFASSTGRPGELTYPGPRGPTTQFPGTTGGYSPGKPQSPGFPISHGAYPGSQGPSHPSTQGSSYPGPQISQGSSHYPAPTGPSGQYPGSHGSNGSQRPDGAFPGAQSPSGPSYDGAQGPSYSGSHGPSGSSGPSENGHYEESFDEGDYSAIPGQPDTDYPIYSYIPETSFRCDQQQYPGYYADIEARCQVFHICANNQKFDFLCPNGTIFHQEFLVCVWWNQFDCNSASSLYSINANIYDQTIGGQGSGVGPHDGQGSQGASPSYPGSEPEGPSPGYPGSRAHGSAPGYSGNGPQKPASGYSDSGPEGPSSGYPGSGTHRPAPGYPGNGQQKPAPGYPGHEPQRPAPGYPASGQISGPGYPGPGTQGPNAEYPGPKSQGHNGYPGPQGYNPNHGGTGYPSPGKPSTPFPGSATGGPQQPTREYLPPVNG